LHLENPSTQNKLVTAARGLRVGERRSAAAPVKSLFRAAISILSGPKPTAEKRKQIDREYMEFLDCQKMFA
jgi:hypothetical protein